MANYLVTGFTGEDVTASLDAHMHAALVGAGSYVTALGNQLAASIVDANTIRLADGALFFQGLFACVPTGQTVDVTIESGSQGQNRLDLVGFRYRKNTTTGTETGEFVSIKGTAVAGTPTAPDHTTGNCFSGAVEAFMPLYLVRLTGITLESVTRHGQWDQLSPVSLLKQEQSEAISSLQRAVTSLQTQCAGLAITPGTTLTIQSMHCSGALSGSGTSLFFFIPLSRPLVGVTSVSVTNPDVASVTARRVSGGYIAQDVKVKSLGTVSCEGSENGIAVRFRAADAYDAVNNTPVAVTIENFSLTFS